MSSGERSQAAVRANRKPVSRAVIISFCWSRVRSDVSTCGRPTGEPRSQQAAEIGGRERPTVRKHCDDRDCGVLQPRRLQSRPELGQQRGLHTPLSPEPFCTSLSPQRPLPAGRRRPSGTGWHILTAAAAAGHGPRGPHGLCTCTSFSNPCPEDASHPRDLGRCVWAGPMRPFPRWTSAPLQGRGWQARSGGGPVTSKETSIRVDRKRTFKNQAAGVFFFNQC